MVRMAFQEFERLLGRVPVASGSTLRTRRAPRACMSFFRTSSCLTQGLVSSKRAFAVVNTDRTSVAVRAMSAVPKRSLKRRLNDDAAHRGYGVFLMSESPIVAEIMARAGHDFVVVDLEHSPAGVHAALPLLQAVECAGRDALIRVALNRPELIKKALDVGPSGLIVPLVNSAEEARAVAAACRYPPGLWG